MQTGGRRGEIDVRLAAWGEELELLRVRLASAPPELHRKYHDAFIELYHRKEALRSRWEAVRGVYRPDAGAMRGVEEALAAMEAAWVGAEPMVAEILSLGPREA